MGIGADRYDNVWIGWPRMLVKDDVGYVYYTGGEQIGSRTVAQIGLRTIPIRDLTDWQSEGGETIQLLR
jgi:hypothetical protein